MHTPRKARSNNSRSTGRTVSAAQVFLHGDPNGFAGVGAARGVVLAGSVIGPQAYTIQAL